MLGSYKSYLNSQLQNICSDSTINPTTYMMSMPAIECTIFAANPGGREASHSQNNRLAEVLVSYQINPVPMCDMVSISSHSSVP